MFERVALVGKWKAKSADDGRLRLDLYAFNELGEGISPPFNQFRVGGEGIEIELAVHRIPSRVSSI